ncbi:hypothetical protein LINPERHAP1_LOCUS22007, partial [Linum perenne]
DDFFGGGAQVSRGRRPEKLSSKEVGTRVRRWRRWLSPTARNSLGKTRVWFWGFGWHFRDSSITSLLELRLTHRQNWWNQNDETDVLGQNSESAFRLSFSFQVRVVRVSELKFRSFLVCRVSVLAWRRFLKAWTRM